MEGVGFQLRSLRDAYISVERPVNRTNQEHLFKVGAVGDFAGGLLLVAQMVGNQLATQQTGV